MPYVELSLLKTLDTTTLAAIEEGVAFWNNAINSGHQGFTVESGIPLSECGLDVSLEAGEVINGLRVYATSELIDGEGAMLAQAGACLNHEGFPAVGVLTLDAADIPRLLENGNLVDVVKHELAHVLGFGAQWASRSLVNNACNDRVNCNSNPTYSTQHARDAFTQIGGQSFEQIFVEDRRGDNAHWRESFFGNELMTSSLDLGMPNPVSILTLKSFMDLGYNMNLNAADEYLIPSEFTSFGNEKVEFIGDMLAFNVREIRDADRTVTVIEGDSPYSNEFGALFGVMLIGFVGLAGMMYYFDKKMKQNFAQVMGGSSGKIQQSTL